MACSQVVRTCLEMGINKLEVEGDALIIIKKWRNNAMDRYAVCAYIRDIKQLKGRFHEITFTHVPRYANLTPHLLAKESLRRNEEFLRREGFQTS